jgi:hypothetical protein
MNNSEQHLATFLKSYKLKSGIYKGKLFYETPITYRFWLMNENWFHNECEQYVNEKMNEEAMLPY